MNSQRNKKSFNSFWKFSKFLVPSLLFLTTFTTSLVVKLSSDNKPAFYNYESYIDPANQACLSQDYNYSVFQNISEFQSFLQQSKTIGGITSDFQVVSLINEGLVQSINHSLIYKNFPTHASLEEQEKFLQQHWRGQVWAHFQSFNKYLTKNDRYWRYVLPYYMQDKVVAYNVDKLSRKNLANLTTTEQNEGITFVDQSFYGVIKTLSQKGFKRIGWTNSPQDNLLHGAYYHNFKLSQKHPSSTPFHKLSTLVTEENLKEYVDSFLELVNDATGAPLSDTTRNFLVSDGLDLVTRLIDPNGDLDAAILYNGDALDAYFYEDNFPSLETREEPYLPIKFVRPIDNIVFSDVLVVSSKLSTEESNKLLNKVYSCVYQGINLPENKILDTHKQLIQEEENSSEDSLRDTFSHSNTLSWLRNFDFINYTPTHQNFYNFFYKYYFLDEEGQVDETAREMYEVYKNDGQHIFTPIQPLNKQISSLLNIEYFLKTHS